MSEQESTPRRVYARPADRSLAAYKDFILTILATINPGAADDHNEEWWEEAWREFWASTDAASEQAAAQASKDVNDSGK